MKNDPTHRNRVITINFFMSTLPISPVFMDKQCVGDDAAFLSAPILTTDGISIANLFLVINEGSVRRRERSGQERGKKRKFLREMQER